MRTSTISLVQSFKGQLTDIAPYDQDTKLIRYSHEVTFHWQAL